MKFFKRDPIKKQINTFSNKLPKDKKNTVRNHLFKGTTTSFVDIIERDDPPEIWSLVAEIYAYAIQASEIKMQRASIAMLGDILYVKANLLKPYENDICNALLVHLSNEDLGHYYRKSCARLLVQLNDRKCIGTLKSLVSDRDISHEDRESYAACLAAMKDQGSADIIKSLVLDESIPQRYRISYAQSLVNIEGENSIDTVHLFFRSLGKIDVGDLPVIFNICRTLELPDGKGLATSAIDIYSQYTSNHGILSAENAYKAAISYLVTLSDDETLDVLVKTISMFVSRLKALNTENMTSSRLYAPSEGLSILVKALAPLKDQRIVESLTNHIVDVAHLSDHSRSVGPNQFVALVNIQRLKERMREVVGIWQKLEHSQALSYLTTQLGEEQVNQFMSRRRVTS